MTDPIGDMIIRIKNAGRAQLDTVVMPHSRLKEEIASVLTKAGYIASAEKKGKKIKKFLEIGILYAENKTDGKRAPLISDVKRISKPSRRVYESSKDIRAPRGMWGSAILSTPKGIMLDREAKKQNVGGEVLFKIFA